MESVKKNERVDFATSKRTHKGGRREGKGKEGRGGIQID
jgi:hypothetical protein